MIGAVILFNRPSWALGEACSFTKRVVNVVCWPPLPWLHLPLRASRSRSQARPRRPRKVASLPLQFLAFPRFRSMPAVFLKPRISQPTPCRKIPPLQALPQPRHKQARHRHPRRKQPRRKQPRRQHPHPPPAKPRSLRRPRQKTKLKTPIRPLPRIVSFTLCPIFSLSRTLVRFRL